MIFEPAGYIFKLTSGIYEIIDYIENLRIFIPHTLAFGNTIEVIIRRRKLTIQLTKNEERRLFEKSLPLQFYNLWQVSLVREFIGLVNISILLQLIKFKESVIVLMEVLYLVLQKTILFKVQ